VLLLLPTRPPPLSLGTVSAAAAAE